MYDATGTPIGPVSNLSPIDGTHEMNAHVAGFWANEDRYVAAWAATNNDGTNIYSIEYLIKNEQGTVVAPVSIAVSGLIGLPWFDVTAVGSGFALVYTTSDSNEVMFRTFSALGVPYGSWTSISYEAPLVFPMFPKITAGLWSPYPYRPVPYFVITWTAQSAPNSRAIRYSLVRGVANPELLVVGETLATQYAPSGSWAASAELFTSCTADLRIGFVWSVLASSGTGRYGIKKKIVSFTSGQSMVLSGGMATAHADYNTLGLDEAGPDEELSFVIPELGEECLDEPEVPMLEE